LRRKPKGTLRSCAHPVSAVCSLPLPA
jgi:hypothetical protein